MTTQLPDTRTARDTPVAAAPGADLATDLHGSTPAPAGLRKGTVGLAGVLMQSMAQISPTLGVFYTIAFTTSQAGVTAPLTYLAAFVVCLILAVPMIGLARHLPSAGGLYTYVSVGIGPRAGFIAGWMYAVMVTIVPASLTAFTGAVLEDQLRGKYGIPIPWWAYAMVILALCFACAYRGIAISIKVLVVMTVFEMVVGFGLALCGLFKPGPGGVNFDGFIPSNIPSSSGFFLAIVLSIFAFTGFESAAAVGEESRDPKRLIPRAIFGSLLLIGLFYCFCAWGLQIGWGTDVLGSMADSDRAPAFVIADRMFDGASLIVLIALVNSGLGVCIACSTSATRTLYGIARTGALPSFLAATHSKHQTPVNAVLLQTVLAAVVCLGIGIPMGPYNLFNMLGTTGTFVYIPIFILMNIAAFLFFRRRVPQEFSVLSYVVAPIISTVALVLIAYNSLVPMPEMPVTLAPFIALAYFLAGVAILLFRNLRPGKRDWMARAGELPDVD